MKLSTLISHASELFRIIRKSYQPSDRIASQYFRKKKYIGSKERKFISELVFSTQRILLLAEYCFKNSIISSQSKDSNYINTDKENNNDGIIIVSCILSTINSHIGFQAIELFNALPKSNNNNFYSEISDFLLEKFNLNATESEEFIAKIELIYSELIKKATHLIEKEKLNKNEMTILQNRFSMPQWILEKLFYSQSNAMIWKRISSLAESMMHSAPLCIRVNSNSIERDAVIKLFNDNKIPCHKTVISPDGIIIEKRVQLNTLEIFKGGFIEVQDEGSQLISIALAPQKHKKILDACAGAGGKTLHIAKLTDDKANITACDIQIKKLKELSKRVRRSGYKSIKTVFIHPKVFSNDKKAKLPFHKEFDYVLVDAPCSGMGTIRRMPMQKYRLNPELLKRLADNQLKILEFYSKFVRIGGVLLYATCSFMPDENDEVIDKFLTRNNCFAPEPLKPAFKEIILDNLKDDDFKLQLLTSEHGTDCFFIAKMKRINV